MTVPLFQFAWRAGILLMVSDIARATVWENPAAGTLANAGSVIATIGLIGPGLLSYSKVAYRAYTAEPGVSN